VDAHLDAGVLQLERTAFAAETRDLTVDGTTCLAFEVLGQRDTKALERVGDLLRRWIWGLT